MSVLRLSNISYVNSEGMPILNNISLCIEKGEFFSIFGDSGSGKSTLLQIIGGIKQPTSGKIYLDGVDVTNTPSYDRSSNLIFQNYALFPNMTVQENVMFGLLQESLSQEMVKKRTEDALARVKLIPHRHKSVDNLSGGEKQRVAIARAIVKRPLILLLDEPFSALDKSLREQTQLEMVELQESLNMTFLMVTHDQEESMTVSSKIALLQGGSIVQIDTPHVIYESPNCLKVAQFIGEMNIIRGTTVNQKDCMVEVFSEDLGINILVRHNEVISLGVNVSVAIRPEKITVSETQFEGSIFGKVSDIVYLGDMSMYHVALSSGKIIKCSVVNNERISGLTSRTITWDQEVYLGWTTENSFLLMK